MTPEEKLKELGYDIQPLNPPTYPPMAYGKIAGNLLYLSGATPAPVNGKPWSGRVGETYSVEEGYQAARLVAVQQLTMAKTILGDLSRIKQVVKVLGMVNCVPTSRTPRPWSTASPICFSKCSAKRAATPAPPSVCKPSEQRAHRSRNDLRDRVDAS